MNETWQDTKDTVKQNKTKQNKTKQNKWTIITTEISNSIGGMRSPSSTPRTILAKVVWVLHLQNHVPSLQRWYEISIFKTTYHPRKGGMRSPSSKPRTILAKVVWDLHLQNHVPSLQKWYEISIFKTTYHPCKDSNAWRPEWRQCHGLHAGHVWLQSLPGLWPKHLEHLSCICINLTEMVIWLSPAILNLAAILLLPLPNGPWDNVVIFTYDRDSDEHSEHDEHSYTAWLLTCVQYRHLVLSFDLFPQSVK